MLVFAHRGASGEYPENSLLAFEKAIEQKADGIELDVQYHPDHEFILLHDRSLSKFNPQLGHFSEHSLKEIASISLGLDQFVLTLKQALSAIAGRCKVNIELKYDGDSQQEIDKIILLLEQHIIEAEKNFGFTRQQFIVSTFNHKLLTSVSHIPKLSVATLIACHPVDIKLMLNQLTPISVNPSIDCLNHSMVKEIQSLGIQVWVYTVDDLYDLKRCHAWSVDAIFTNFPAKSRQKLAEI